MRYKFFLSEGDKKIKIPAVRCIKPKMTNHRGRVWDFYYFFLDGNKSEMWMDNTWGFFVYWHIGAQWYKCRMMSELLSIPEYDIDPTNSAKRVNLSTTI